MKEQTLETSDATLGAKCKVEKHNTTQNRIRFKNAIAPIGDEVMVLNSEQYQQLINQSKDADKYIAKIKQLQDEIDNNDIKALNKQLAVYEKQVDKLTKSNNSFKQWNDEYKAKIEDLEHKLDKYKQTIADKDATILGLKKDNETNNGLQKQLQEKDAENKRLNLAVNKQSKTISSNDSTIEDLKNQIKELEQEICIVSDSNKKYEHAYQEQSKIMKSNKETISDLKQMNDNIAKEKDKLEKQLEHSVDASEIGNLQEQVATLTKESSDANASVKYWKSSFENLLEKGDELTHDNEKLIKENNDMKNKLDEVNNTNKLLNENLIATNNNFKETKEQIQSDFQKQEKELKETIEKHQSHIDEITEKYQSLLVLQEHIPPKSHYDEILALQQQIKEKEIEIDKLNGDIEVKLATQKSELDSEHADAVNKIQLENTENKAKLSVAYNNDLNKLKIQYNNLASEYNHLLDELDSITKWNALIDSRHKKIRKDKEQVPQLEITSEQLPPSDEDVVEYIPKQTMD